MEDVTYLRLTAAVEAVCPIYGVGGTPGAIRIDAKPGATAQQIAAAEQIATSFDYSKEADEDYLGVPDRAALRSAAIGAIADNDTYLAIANPTQAQVVAQVRRLTQQNQRLIKLARKAL